MEVPIILAILGSGILSTFIVVLNDWIKYVYEKKKDKINSLYSMREQIHKEFLKNIDFIYKADYLSEDEKLKKRHNFLKTYRTLFLYASDEEVKQVNNMLDVIVSCPINESEEMIDKKNKIAEGFLMLRKHVITDTKLLAEDFRHLA